MIATITRKDHVFLMNQMLSWNQIQTNHVYDIASEHVTIARMFAWLILCAVSECVCERVVLLFVVCSLHDFWFVVFFLLAVVLLLLLACYAFVLYTVWVYAMIWRSHRMRRTTGTPTRIWFRINWPSALKFRLVCSRLSWTTDLFHFSFLSILLYVYLCCIRILLKFVFFYKFVCSFDILTLFWLWIQFYCFASVLCRWK